MIETILALCGGFILGAGGDFFWAKWSHSCTDKKPYVAANWSMLIYITGLCYTLMIVHSNFPMVAAYLVGGYVGTVTAVKYS